MLRVEGLTKRFGGLVAVNDVSFEVPTGQVMSIVGPNGAGKTTVFNLITGVLPADARRSLSERQAHHRLAAAQIWPRTGIGRTFQNIRLFQHLNALENVMIGRTARTRAGVFSALAAHACRPGASGRRPSSMRRRCSTGSASGQTASACRASCPTATSAESRSPARWRSSPVLLILDEPTAGMVGSGGP